MTSQLQNPIRLMTRWHSDELLGQTLAWLLTEHGADIKRWLARPERLLVLHGGPWGSVGDGLAFGDISDETCQKLTGLRFAKLVLRKNLPEQYDANEAGWHVHAFYPLPQLPLNWTGDRNFNYLSQHLAGYFVSGIADAGDGLEALTTDLKLAQTYAPAMLPRLAESLEPLLHQLWPVEIAATFWQEQLNRPLSVEFEAPILLAAWATQIAELLRTI